MSLATDSLDYEILREAARRSPGGIDFPWIEVGTREGGSAEMLLELAPPQTTLVSVDPYGGIPYYAWATNQATGKEEWCWVPGIAEQVGYTSEMRVRATTELLGIAEKLEQNFLPLPMTDEDFMDCFESGVPVYWRGHRYLRNTYGLVFLDGPHSQEAQALELEFFIPRLAARGCLVVDDHFYEQRQAWWDEQMLRWGLLALQSTPRKVAFTRGQFVENQDGKKKVLK